MKTETEYKHRKGPWKKEWHKDGNLWSIRSESPIIDEDGDEDYSIAGIWCSRKDKEAEANAELIAQAPSLLQERDTLKEANKELIVACEKAMSYLRKTNIVGPTPDFIESALLKHRKGE